jgi:hypothetical protein
MARKTSGPKSLVQTGKPNPAMASNSPAAALPDGAKTYHRLGVVQYVKTSYGGNTLTPALLRSILSAVSPQSRIQRLETRAAKLNTTAISDELGFVKQLLADGSLRAMGKKDPLHHALNALERLVAIAETEQYVKPVVVGKKFITQQTRTGKFRPDCQTDQGAPSEARDRQANRGLERACAKAGKPVCLLQQHSRPLH